MDDAIRQAVDRLDTRSSLDGENAWVAIRAHGSTLMPYFRQAYSRFRSADGRTALVFYATRYARVSEEAFELGRLALSDRSKLVRVRACGLFAYSLRADAIPLLKAALDDKDASVREVARAAVTAISRQNHHLFVDQKGSGRSFWAVNPEDKPDL